MIGENKIPLQEKIDLKVGDMKNERVTASEIEGGR